MKSNPDRVNDLTAEPLRPRYRVRNRRQIQATTLLPVEEREEIDHRKGLDGLLHPSLRIDGSPVVSRVRPVSPQSAVSLLLSAVVGVRLCSYATGV
jgi:hypothetical protein